jgi:hypothetical protein
MAAGVSAGRQIELRIGGISHPVELEPETTETLEQADWFVCTSCGYTSEQEARENGERLRTAFVLAGARNRLGVDCGFDRYTFKFSEYITDLHRKSTGRELRGSTHGLDIFEKDKVHVAVASKPTLKALASPATLQKDIQDAMNLCADLSERQQICASLINDSFFVTNRDVRFVMLVSAVEALCDQHDVHDSYRSLIDHVLNYLSGLEGFEAGDKESLSSALSYQKSESIGHAYRSKITTLLGPDKSKEFGKLYRLRSEYVHDGKRRGEVGKRSEEVLKIAIELLEADIRATSHIACG